MKLDLLTHVLVGLADVSDEIKDICHMILFPPFPARTDRGRAARGLERDRWRRRRSEA